MRFRFLPALRSRGERPKSGRRGRGRGERERGAVLVEAALIIPLLVLLAMGVAEWSMVFKDKLEVVSVARAGARTASSLAPLQRPYVAPSPGFTQQTADAVQAAASALPKNSIDFMLVYQARADGRPQSGAWTCTGAETTCDRFTWNDATSKFNPTVGTQWNASSINACMGDAGIQSVGVYIQATHRMMTGLFGSTKTVSSYTVMRFEPQKPGRCKP